MWGEVCKIMACNFCWLPSTSQKAVPDHLPLRLEGLHGPAAGLHLLCDIPYNQPLVSQGPVGFAKLQIVMQSMR